MSKLGRAKKHLSKQRREREREMESCKVLKNIIGKLLRGQDDVRETWEEYSEDIYNLDSKEYITSNMFSLDDTGRCIILREQH